MVQETTILGMSTSTFTLVHVLLSLVGIGSGLLVLYGMLFGKCYDTAQPRLFWPRPS